jgi:hypothetical protein
VKLPGVEEDEASPLPAPARALPSGEYHDDEEGGGGGVNRGWGALGHDFAIFIM